MKGKFARVVVVVLLLLSPLIVWRWLLTHHVNRRLAAVRAGGYPLNGEELNRWYAPVPDNENAALVLTQAFALHRDYPDDRSKAVWDFKLPARGQPLSSEQIELLEEYVVMNLPMVAKVEEATHLPASRFPIDCLLLQETPLPHLLGFRRVSRLNESRAVLAIQAGNPGEASASVEATLNLARTLDDEPLMISQLVRVGMLNSAVATFERRVNAGALSPEEATNLAAAFARTRATNQVSLALIGERAMLAPYFRMSEAERTRRIPPKGDPEDGASRHYRSLAFRLIGVYEGDFGQFLLTMGTNISIAGRPPPENLRADGYFARVSDAAWKAHRPISGSVFSAFAGCVAREVEGVAYHRMATTALAVEQFRNQHGRLPATLEELAPAFLAEEPEDPFDGFPLRYRRTEEGYILYSVGRDGQDDDGLEESERKGSSDGRSYDLTFVVER